MAKIDGRKYEVELDDGRTVSRQYAHYLLNKEEYDERRRATRYNTPEKLAKHRSYHKKWREKFEEEHGMPYWKWHKLNKHRKD